MNQKNIELFIVGTALTYAFYTFLPFAKTMVQRTREEIEDIVAEAKFERMKKQFDQEIMDLA